VRKCNNKQLQQQQTAAATVPTVPTVPTVSDNDGTITITAGQLESRKCKIVYQHSYFVMRDLLF